MTPREHAEQAWRALSQTASAIGAGVLTGERVVAELEAAIVQALNAERASYLKCVDEPIDAAIAEATALEREACAKVAHEFAEGAAKRRDAVSDERVKAFAEARWGEALAIENAIRTRGAT